MRRNSRKSHSRNSVFSNKALIQSSVLIGIIALVVGGIFLYSKSINKEVKKSTMPLEQMASIAQNEEKANKEKETESASTDIGKSVDEAKSSTSENEANNSVASNTTSNNASSASNTANTASSSSALNTANNANTSKASNGANTANTVNNSNAANANSNKSTDTSKANEKSNNAAAKTEETKKELSFKKPVEGEISMAFAKENLVYSNTLEEWVTHLGVDIKADKTTVVKAAEDGTVKSIKNDPRYGLTIVIEHENGFQTVYANLLSSEFVVEGEKVKKGQTIGTVGNTGAFESADEPHLHFEILKDSIQQDPNIYLK